MASEGWTIVSSRRRSSRHRLQHGRSLPPFDASRIPAGVDMPALGICTDPGHCAEEEDASSLLGEDEKKLISMVDRTMEKVRASPFYKRLLEQVQSFRSLDETVECSGHSKGTNLKALLRLDFTEPQDLELVVYGIGSIAESEVSRCQFSLALLLRQALAPIHSVLVYDPILSPSERRVLRAFGCSPLQFNEQGRRQVKRPTLFYMPHCEVGLYDNLVQANWSCLAGLAILGNSFRNYMERWSVYPRPNSPCPSYVLQVQPDAEEHTVDAMEFPASSAFNDMSWHFFPPRYSNDMKLSCL